ncbi:MAG TPA: DUF1501 domain-containing protein [bacterium]|nr:DUF1501 domain-containing protein [bacterium]
MLGFIPEVLGAPFGDFPTAQVGQILPTASRAKRVLEIFLYGGLSPWETLYFVPEYGTPTDPQYPNQQFYTFGGGGPDSVAAALAACGLSAEPNGVPFAPDANGKTVNLGPFAVTLRNRTDLTDRMRLLVMRHDLEPHEAAIPLALSGKRVGLPSLAGLGAHIQRFFNDHGDGSRQSPWSYVFSTGGLPGDNVLAAAATGFHPGTARPLLIKVDSAQALYNLLARSAVGTTTDRQKYDAAIAAYVNRYQDQLRYPGAPDPLRSPRFSDLAQSAVAVSHADAVATVLDPSLFTPLSGNVCGDASSQDIPGMSLKIAAHLLTHPTEPASYVCVSDTGLIEASGGGGYDTHTDNSHDTARNFKNLLDSLAAIINTPGEGNPAKISLDDTMIILNTEFGRTPVPQQGGNGRNHHPYGYVTALIGGPITTAQKGVYGAIGPDGMASTWVTPAEGRIAALLALGIYPFAQEAFFVSDVQGASTEADAITSVTLRTLGYTV